MCRNPAVRQSRAELTRARGQAAKGAVEIRRGVLRGAPKNHLLHEAYCCRTQGSRRGGYAVVGTQPWVGDQRQASGGSRTRRTPSPF